MLYTYREAEKKKCEGDAKKQPKLWNAIKASIMRGWWKAAVLYFIWSLLLFVPPQLLNTLVRYLEGQIELTTQQLWFIVALNLVAPLVGSFCFTWHNHIAQRVGIRARNAVAVAVYDKALRLSAAARGSTSVGNIVNIMSNDAQRLQDVFVLLNGLWSSPLQILIAMVLLFRLIQWSMFSAILFLVPLAFINMFVFKKIISYVGNSLRLDDSRVKFLNEIFIGIKVFKMYAWEKAFRRRVKDIRDKQLVWLRKIAILIAVGFLFVLLAAPLLMPVVVFAFFTSVGNQGELTAALVFTTLSLFQLIKLPFTFFPIILQQIGSLKVSLDRIQKFLELPENPTEEELRELEGEQQGEVQAEDFISIAQPSKVALAPSSSNSGLASPSHKLSQAHLAIANSPSTNGHVPMLPPKQGYAVEIHEGVFDWGDASAVQGFDWGVKGGWVNTR